MKLSFTFSNLFGRPFQVRLSALHGSLLQSLAHSKQLNQLSQEVYILQLQIYYRMVARYYLLVLFCLFLIACSSVERERFTLQQQDPHQLYINDGDSTMLFYDLYRTTDRTSGILILIAGAGELTTSIPKQSDLVTTALANGITVVIPSHNFGTLKRIHDITFLNQVINHVLTNQVPESTPVVIGGFSNGGMLALSYGIRSVQKGDTRIIPAGIIAVDPPVDFKSFYAYTQREITRSSSDIGMQEAKFIQQLFHHEFGGSPHEIPHMYEEYSPYSYDLPHGGNANYLTEIPIRIHTDLNTEFLIEQRNRDLYDWNGARLIAFARQLKANGNKDVSLVVSKNKGVRSSGEPHPHSWNIVMQENTIDWILNKLRPD